MTPLLTSQGDAGKLDELIERVAAAPGHSRFLDAAILATLRALKTLSGERHG